MMRVPLYELDLWNKEKIRRFQEGAVLFTDASESYWSCGFFWFRDCTYWDMASKILCARWVWSKWQLASSMPTSGWVRSASFFCQQSIPVLGSFKKPFLSKFMWNIERVVRDFHEFVFFAELHDNLQWCYQAELTSQQVSKLGDEWLRQGLWLDWEVVRWVSQKTIFPGIFLVAQWLRLHDAHAGGVDLIPGWWAHVLRGVVKKKKNHRPLVWIQAPFMQRKQEGSTATSGWGDPFWSLAKSRIRAPPPLQCERAGKTAASLRSPFTFGWWVNSCLAWGMRKIWGVSLGF